MMKRYEKPSIEVFELQLKENIAAVPTTVYKGSLKSDVASTTSPPMVEMALTQTNTGLAKDGDLVTS